jgi:hypothetical protein
LARQRLQGALANWASRISGVLIVLFGLGAMGSYLLGW